MNFERKYDIDKLVERFVDQYKEKTGNLDTGKSKTVIKRPEITSLNKKMYVQNFSEVCNSINREPNEVSVHIGKELNVPASISGNGSLIIHGTYRKNQLENVIKKYVISYVQCPLCKSHDTKVNKSNKITYIVCNKCHASNSIE